MPPKRISQTQIAKELGYSQALVSMVLNGRTQGISETAYKRIWDYATRHGYSPRGMSFEKAQGSAATNTIGYILRSPLKLATKSNFFSHIHQGLHDYLDQHRIKTVFLGSEDNIDVDRLSENGVMSNSVKGIAIMGEVAPDFLEGVRKLDLPIVYISSRATGKCHSVLANEEESGTLLVDHLHALGHRHFAWLGGNKNLGRHRERYSGVIEALKRHGLTLDPKFEARHEGADRMEGHEAARQIVEAAQGNLPTAWISLNSLMARGAISYLFQKGIRVGMDVSIAAIDMTKVCTEENPRITCASAVPEEMGSEAGHILMESLNGSNKSWIDITLPALMKTYESTGPAPAQFAEAEPSAT